jgi:trehalose synthase
MGAHVRAAEVLRNIRLQDYRNTECGGEQLEAASHQGVEVRARLGTGRVWMLSSTETGGGVAEMLPRVCGLLNEVGVDTRWLVLEPELPEFFRATKSLHAMLHGMPGRVPPADLRAIFARVSEEAVGSLSAIVDSHDILVVHDPQPAGVAAMLPASQRPLLLWRCHVGVPGENEQTRAAWELLAPYLAPFSRLLFSCERYIPASMRSRSGVLMPMIDPLSHKNRELRLYKLLGVLRSAGLIEGPPVPEWARFRTPARRCTHDGWVARPVPELLQSPLVLQVSRFDRLKGFDLLMPAFELMLRLGDERVRRMRVDTGRAADELSRALLLLAGPEPGGVSDDPEAEEVLGDLVQQWQTMPPSVAARIHLLRLPMANKKENALMVNALQRAASVVVQYSRREGFGLTACEALWKGAPLVAANVGGLGLQVRPGTDGLLVEPSDDPEPLAHAILEQLLLRPRAEQMAAAGHRRVAENFLIVSQVVRWLDELMQMLVTRDFP